MFFLGFFLGEVCDFFFFGVYVERCVCVVKLLGLVFKVLCLVDYLGFFIWLLLMVFVLGKGEIIVVVGSM